MAESDVKKNTSNLLRIIQSTSGKLTTNIAKSMGYTSTAQLHSVLQGESLISTKAITCLVDNMNVNPTYIFTGKGDMFLTDESEIESLRKERSEWERKFFAIQDDLMKSQAELETAILRYNRLIDITSIAMEKTQKAKEKEEKTGTE